MLTFKARVKSVEVEGRKYFVIFSYQEKFKTCNAEYGIAYDDNSDNTNNKPNTEALPLNVRFEAEETIFNFISQHTREILEISYEDNAIRKVKLSYE